MFSETLQIQFKSIRRWVLNSRNGMTNNDKVKDPLHFSLQTEEQNTEVTNSTPIVVNTNSVTVTENSVPVTENSVLVTENSVTVTENRVTVTENRVTTNFFLDEFFNSLEKKESH
jgi:hypothetical protein